MARRITRIAEIAVTTHPEHPSKFYIRPPENFYDLSEEEQLAWTRQVGEHLKAGSSAEPVADSEADEDDQPSTGR